ncbi:methyltransferase [Pontibacillus halophilus JSM 076056 = DSM 19796]|uniref:Methyltransferase n=1 Tax=Pontibacillus halophilus JSM 076056 = DSM 19796 TaxID=1385510 RepID=A0A0A5GGQ9_9BACI|nr:class I SAM-dependent methyltransferase [Pontibacillus halophilus]KGX90398.1 methyltransferase [Pontibacillus halophilus JSM 076056 = DSM 19796]
MTEHYYSKSPETKSAREAWTFVWDGHKLRFTVDRGVFSRNEVDFGSRTLLESFEAPSVEGDILDLGCGYGPIGISLGKVIPNRNITMVDINERAVELAKENAANNQVYNVDILQSDSFEAIEGRTFAAVLTNPPIRAGKHVVHSFIEQSYHSLLDHGELWVVIQKKQGAPSAQKKMNELFGEVEVVTKNKGYYILRGKKV